MTQTITAVYENGILRPLTPLALPEHSQVEIEVRTITEESALVRRERVRLVLAAAGLLIPGGTNDKTPESLTAEQRMTLGSGSRCPAYVPCQKRLTLIETAADDGLLCR